MDWWVSLIIGFILGVVASIVGAIMIMPYFEKWKEPNVTGSFVTTFGFNDGELWINGRVQNILINDRFKKWIVRGRNEIKRLAIGVSIVGEDSIGSGRKVLRPMVIDRGMRGFWYTDSPDQIHEWGILPSSAILTVETKTIIVSQGEVKAYQQNGIDMVDLQDGGYNLTMQVCADGRVINFSRKLRVTNNHSPFVEWLGQIEQEEKLPLRGL